MAIIALDTVTHQAMAELEDSLLGSGQTGSLVLPESTLLHLVDQRIKKVVNWGLRAEPERIVPSLQLRYPVVCVCPDGSRLYRIDLDGIIAEKQKWSNIVSKLRTKL